MKINISFWIEWDMEDVCIRTLHDLTYNPFRLNQVFWLRFEEYTPKDREDLSKKGWPEHLMENMITEYNELSMYFLGNHQVKIVNEDIVFNMKTGNLSIDYTLEQVNDD